MPRSGHRFRDLGQPFGVRAVLGVAAALLACTRDAASASRASAPAASVPTASVPTAGVPAASLARNDAAPSAPRRETVAETAPRMQNATPPFHYPAALYTRKVQGNVVLRVVVDSGGHVWPDSTTVAQSSGVPALDSAALRGAPQLTFAPATRDGRPVSASVRFPVFFRHPAARPLPGDSVLQKP